MKEAHGDPVRGRTRWRRFVALLVPAFVAAFALVLGMANGAIAASFSVSGSQFKVSANLLDGKGFVQYGGFASEKGAKTLADGSPDPTDQRNHPVAVSGIASATLTNLCQSVKVPNLPLTMVLRSGREEGKPVTATNLLIDMSSLKGDASFDNVQIGIDASSLSKGGPNARGIPGGFGQQADRVVINNLQQVAWSTTAGQFNLVGLDLSLSTGSKAEECFAG